MDSSGTWRSFSWWDLVVEEQLLERRGWVESINRQLDNLDRRWQLRQKFLEQAKQYIGVPYAQKYHEPGSPEYQSPLFLDCCGLVRRTMRDLKSEFGFLLGPGNQAYQYDTLPISQSEEEMKPGDLVFISGTYLNPQRKRQIHDTVHVEIWLGEGQRTLGARWQRGTVQVFESYRFVSTSYGDMKYHFKSLDTWLQGTCVSHCPEHRWGSSSYHPGKLSIFYPWDDQQEPCEDSWEDPGDSTLKATTMQIIDGEVCNAEEAAQDGNQVIEVLKGADSPTEAGQDISVSASLGDPTGVSVPAELRQDGDRALSIPEEVTISGTEDISVKELASKDIIQASGDVTHLAPAAAHVKREDTVDENLMSDYVVQGKGASEAADPSKTSKVSQKLRRVSESKEKNDTVKLSRQLTKNTSSSTKLHPRMVTKPKTNKKRWQRRTQQTRSTLGHAAPTESANAEPLKDTKEEAKTDQEQSTEDAVSAEKRPVDFRGPGPYFFIGGSNGASLVAAYCLRKGWQRLYDPNREDYKLKWCEIKTAATYRSFREGEQLVYQIPNNKILTTKIGLLQSLREYERMMIKVSGFRSPRILRLEEFFPETYRLDVKEERDNFFAFYQGRKFDVRSYFLIASTAPYIVFFRHGYVRLTCNIYDPRSDDLTGHLTNQYMQKKHPLYRELKEDTVWTMERFNTYVNERFAAEKRLATDWVLTLFTKRMQQIMVHCFLAVKNKLESKMGYFDLIGCDFLIDEDFKVWFLEMNCNPALHTNCEVLKDVVPGVVNETLDLVLEIFYKSVKHHPIFPLESQKNFVPLFTGDSPYPGLKLSRSRTSLSPPKIPRTLRTDSEEQSPIICKEPEKYPKKAWSLADNSLVSSMRNPTSKFLNRVPMSISQVQVTEVPTLAGLSHSVKLKTKYEASDYPSSSTKSEIVNDEPELGKFKTTHERSSLGLQRFQIQENESLPLPGSHYDAIARRGEMVHSLHLHSKAPITNQSFEHLELLEPGQIDGAIASTSATI